MRGLDPAHAETAREQGASPYRFKASRWSSHSLILRHLSQRLEPARIIDIGGGEGYLSARLRRLGHRVVCVAKPGTKSPDFPADVDLVEADLDVGYPAVAGLFDYAICGDVLEHLRDPGQALRWLHARLRPGGALIASLPNGVHLYVRLHVLLGRFPTHDRGPFDRTHLHFYSLEGWRSLLRASGFDVIDLRVTPVPFSLLLGPRLARPLEWLAYAAARAWKTLLAYQFVVVARPRWS